MTTNSNPEATGPAHFEIWNRETQDPDWNGRFNYLTYDEAKESLLSDDDFNDDPESENYWGRIYEIILWSDEEDDEDGA